MNELLTKKRIDEIEKRMNEILKENGGLISNVPINVGSEYYTLKEELATLRSKD